MAVRDLKTEWLRIKIYRNMTPQQRILMAAQMYEEGVAMARSAILDRHPKITQVELERQIRRRLLPRNLYEKVEAALRERR